MSVKRLTITGHHYDPMHARNAYEIVLASDHEAEVSRLTAEVERLKRELAEARGRWVPWNRDTDESPESGWYLTTVRRYCVDELRATGVADFAKDNVIAYYSIPLPPACDARQDGGREDKP